MIRNYTICAIALARSGSTRIPKKNIKLLAGKPLIAYTFEEGKKSKYVDRFIITTDDLEVIKIAKHYGVEAPFIRPAELAENMVADYPVFMHALGWLKEHEKYEPDIVVQLRPTSPLRTAAQIDKAIELLVEHPDADCVRTVTEPEQSPYKMFAINKEGFLKPLLTVPGVPESYNLPQQKLPKAYKHVGYLDVMWRKTLTEKGKMTGDKIFPYILEHAESGINVPEDWDYYEYLITKRYD
jgi:N-acylneuraminate cytidylyltransferase